MKFQGQEWSQTARRLPSVRPSHPRRWPEAGIGKSASRDPISSEYSWTLAVPVKRGVQLALQVFAPRCLLRRSKAAFGLQISASSGMTPAGAFSGKVRGSRTISARCCQARVHSREFFSNRSNSRREHIVTAAWPARLRALGPSETALSLRTRSFPYDLLRSSPIRQDLCLELRALSSDESAVPDVPLPSTRCYLLVTPIASRKE